MKLRQQAPPRRWFRHAGGTYYRNCPLIKAEWEEVLAWPASTSRKFRLAEALSAEWYAVFAAGVTRKAELEPGDELTTPAPFRETYPRHPGLWALDERNGATA